MSIGSDSSDTDTQDYTTPQYFNNNGIYPTMNWESFSPDKTPCTA